MLFLLRGGERTHVQAHPCFPWSRPGEYLSLRNEKGEELAFIASPEELEETSREALELTFREAGFTLVIQRVLSLERVFEIRNWKVGTRQGVRTFQTRLDDWPVQLPDGGLLIQDVAGDLFRIDRPEGLDTASRRLVWGFLD